MILLFREDAYDHGSAHPGEAELILAKHREGPAATLRVAHQPNYSRFVDAAPAAVSAAVGGEAPATLELPAQAGAAQGQSDRQTLQQEA